MLYRKNARKRSAATVVESAIVLPAVMLLLIGLIVGGLGVFRFQQMAHVARETARYASLHGARFAADNPSAAVVNLNALKAYAASKAEGLDTSTWTVTVSMTVFAPGASSDGSTPPATTTIGWDDTINNQNHSPYSSWANTVTNKATTAANLVTVTVTYPWMPELFVVGPINLTSTTVVAMSY